MFKAAEISSYHPQDKELAMFVEDFIIDAYSIQLREEVGGKIALIAQSVTHRLSLHSGATSPLQHQSRRSRWK